MAIHAETGSGEADARSSRFSDSGWKPLVVAALLFAATSGIMLFPVLRYQGDVLPLARTGSMTVPLFNAWSVWWNADRAAAGWSDYWDAPIFADESGAFALSEPQPATLLVSPLIWMGGTPAQAALVWLWFSLAANGIAGWSLLRRLGVPATICHCGGVSIQLLPLSHQQLDVQQLVPVWGILWTWSALLTLSQLGRNHSAGVPRWLLMRTSLQVAVAVAATAATCLHHALFLCLLLPFSVILIPGRGAALRAASLAMAGISTVCLLLPLVVPVRQVMERYQFERSDKLVTTLSARAVDYVHPPAECITAWPKSFRRYGRRGLNPGPLHTAAALSLLALCLGTRRFSPFGIWLTATTVAATLLSFGAHLQIGSWNLWESLIRPLPGFSQVRSVYRFAWFVQLSLHLAAFTSLGVLARRFSSAQVVQARRTESSRSKHASSVRGRIPYWGICLAALVTAAEYWPFPYQFGGVPQLDPEEPWIAVLRDNTPQDSRILCLPMAASSRMEDFEPTTRWMYLQSLHRRRLVNGYSGFFPPSYFKIQHAWNDGTAAEFANAVTGRVDYLVMYTPHIEADRVKSVVATLPCRLVYDGGSGYRIYQVQTGP